ncbi:MAG: TIGR03759 family integrating conjugative element protein [Gammaproteobacteria bacterium]|nr:TIGR03759 family integrating conjugative element protein [Gammaproteobacteria bacterium]
MGTLSERPKNFSSALRFFGGIAFVFFFLFISSHLHAAEPSWSRFNYTESKEILKKTPEVQNTQVLASRLGLTQEEWRQYEGIMQNEGQFRLQGVDPVWVLGIAAKNPEERKRYAELAAKNEEKYTEETLAFQKAFLEARNRLYGGRVSLSDESQGWVAPNEFRSGDRLLYFLEPHCKTCELDISLVLSWVQKYRIGLDVYFRETRGDNSIVQAWAREHRILPEWVTSRRITLNHDSGEFARFGLGESLPLLLLRRDTHVMRVLRDKP